MSATLIEFDKWMPYAPADLCRLVGDVRTYPDFIPWMKSIRLLREDKGEGGAWQGIAQAIIGWRAITERFTTRVHCDPAAGEVDVSLVEGPLRVLANTWRFTPEDEGARVHFKLEYAFRNPLLQAIMQFNRETAIRVITAAFEEEAARRLGAPAAS